MSSLRIEQRPRPAACDLVVVDARVSREQRSDQETRKSVTSSRSQHVLNGLQFSRAPELGTRPGLMLPPGKQEPKNCRFTAVFKADEGTRTHDLLWQGLQGVRTSSLVSAETS